MASTSQHDSFLPDAPRLPATTTTLTVAPKIKQVHTHIRTWGSRTLSAVRPWGRNKRLICLLWLYSFPKAVWNHWLSMYRDSKPNFSNNKTRKIRIRARWSISRDSNLCNGTQVRQRTKSGEPNFESPITPNIPNLLLDLNHKLQAFLNPYPNRRHLKFKSL